MIEEVIKLIWVILKNYFSLFLYKKGSKHKHSTSGKIWKRAKTIEFFNAIVGLERDKEGKLSRDFNIEWR